MAGIIISILGNLFYVEIYTEVFRRIFLINKEILLQFNCRFGVFISQEAFILNIKLFHESIPLVTHELLTEKLMDYAQILGDDLFSVFSIIIITR